MRFGFGIFLISLAAPNAFAGQIVNVKFIHDYIDRKHNVLVPIANGQSDLQAANMEYLLTAIDVANEILNECPISNYGASAYATKQAADTNASIAGINTLIRLQDRPSPEGAQTGATFTFDGGCTASNCADPSYYNENFRVCMNDGWVMLCNVGAGMISYDGEKFVLFTTIDSMTKQSNDGFSWSNFVKRAFGPGGEFALSNIKYGTGTTAETIWVMTHDINGSGTKYQYFRSGTAFTSVDALTSGKYAEHIQISDDKFVAFDYNRNNLALFTASASGAPTLNMLKIENSMHNGGKFFACNPTGYCVMIAQRCIGYTTGKAYRFEFSKLSSDTNVTAKQDLKVYSDQSADVGTIFGSINGRYRSVSFCNNKFLVVPDTVNVAALSTDNTGEYWNSVDLPDDDSTGNADNITVVSTSTAGNTIDCTTVYQFAGFDSVAGCYDNKFFISGQGGKKVYYSSDPAASGWTAMNLPGEVLGHRAKFSSLGGLLILASRTGSNTFVYNNATPCTPAKGYVRNPILNTCDNKYYDTAYFHEGNKYCVDVCWNKEYDGASGKSYKSSDFDLNDCRSGMKKCIDSMCLASPGA